MFTVLMESRAPRARRVGGTIASALLHGVLIVAAVGVAHPTRGDANPTVRRDPSLVYVPVKHVPTPTHAMPQLAHRQTTSSQMPSLPTIAAPTVTPGTIPPMDIDLPVLEPDQILIGGPGARSGTALGSSGLAPADPGASGAPLEAGVVDRVPRMIGRAEPPRYPSLLRDSGTRGRVVVQFVVDTLGRAEMGRVQIVEASHPLFADAVRGALARYRFSAGEAAGRKVRTMVQMPFEFTLAR
jgi:protein TonB